MGDTLLTIDKKSFEQMVRFVIDAVKKGVPEREIWATLEVMSSIELQEDVEKGKDEIEKGKFKESRNLEELLRDLKSE